MPKYKVLYSGFAYVEADDEETAIELFNDYLEIYREQEIDSINKIDEFTIRI